MPCIGQISPGKSASLLASQPSCLHAFLTACLLAICPESLSYCFLASLPYCCQACWRFQLQTHRESSQWDETNRPPDSKLVCQLDCLTSYRQAFTFANKHGDHTACLQSFLPGCFLAIMFCSKACMQAGWLTCRHASMTSTLPATMLSGFHDCLQAVWPDGLLTCCLASLTHILLASMKAKVYGPAHDNRHCQFQRRGRKIDHRRSSRRLAPRAGAQRHACRLRYAAILLRMGQRGRSGSKGRATFRP